MCKYQKKSQIIFSLKFLKLFKIFINEAYSNLHYRISYCSFLCER